MKLIRTRIQNFRLLKEVELEFSTDPSKNITVLRAANESGKTTLLHALQWGLFGDDALPQKGREFRLSPLDASSVENQSVDISVEIDCELPSRAGAPRIYRLIRSATETVKGAEWNRGAANIKLFHLKSTGSDPIDNAEAHIRPHLPRELREVFFTDGDRALNFIEGSRNEQMKRVEAAIRSLLGLGVIEEALSHTKKVSSNLNKKVQTETDSGRDIAKITDRISELDDEIPELEAKIGSLKEACLNLEDLEKGADRELSQALRKGNKQELEKRRKDAERGREVAGKDAEKAARDHADLFRSEKLGKHLLAGKFEAANTILKTLENAGKIPNQTVPVLEDRLSQKTCICGESLDVSDPDGVKRREHIQHLIDQSQNADEVQKKVTALYYGAQDLFRPIKDETWTDDFSAVFERRQSANLRAQKFGEEIREIEAEISDLPDVDINQLKQARDHYRAQLRDERDKQIRLQAQLETKEHEKGQLEEQRTGALKKNKKGQQLIAELGVAQDIQNVLSNALETMKTRELAAVGEHMNSLFLQMIGADDTESQRSLISRAEITPDFRIIVYGSYEQILDPSQDLNGASRRALTIAFILALTKVSEVEAPNVIDTPLGMMSGYVKRAVMQIASQQSSQLILFLTHAEINGCEDILDQRAGRIYTMTNPAHYPRILLNNPGVNDVRIMVCGCDHRNHCEICERRDGVVFEDEPTYVEA
jgi:DNA sulfur modification protein DndD